MATLRPPDGQRLWTTVGALMHQGVARVTADHSAGPGARVPFRRKDRCTGGGPDVSPGRGWTTARPTQGVQVCMPSTIWSGAILFGLITSLNQACARE